MLQLITLQANSAKLLETSNRKNLYLSFSLLY